MAIVSVRIPQIGEGLQEARLVAVLKQPGDWVNRDEPIYQMETDKAVMDVESPFAGRLTEWLVVPDTILPIGAEVGRMDTDAAVESAPPSHHEPAPSATVKPADASLISVRIPQIGEGLQEARLVAVLKQPGDSVKRDEPIYQMETDKAVMDVESPYEGILVEWLAEADTVLPIGAEVARMKVSGAVEEIASGHGQGSPAPTLAVASTQGSALGVPAISSLRNEFVTPRARAYAKAKGLSDEVLMQIRPSRSRLFPDDIDAFLNGSSAPAPVVAKVTPTAGSGAGGAYQEAAVGAKQRLLASRLVRGSQLVVPGTITVATRWTEIENLRATYKASGGDFQPSAFTMFAFAVAKVLANHPAFRSTLKGDEILRTYDHASLGIAVALPGDELVIAVVEQADTLSWPDFAAKSRERINLARAGTDQANEATTLSLTNMQAFGLRDAVPVVVPPAVGTLFLGEPYRGLRQDAETMEVCTYVNLALTFDHRVVNGVGAAEFVNAVKASVETIGSLIQI